MCGIIGYTGNEPALPVLIEGLRALEYRGYDSAGVAVAQDGGFVVKKTKGKIENLVRELADADAGRGTTGIGHTRWATHGAPTPENAHPHEAKTLWLVHNGIIENDLSLKEELTDEGDVFVSQTDTEVAAHVISRLYEVSGDHLSAIRLACERFDGSYAFAVLYKDEPDVIYAVRHDSPLVIGYGDGCSYVASDVPALLGRTNRYVRPEDGELAVVGKDSIRYFDPRGNPIEKEPQVASWQAGAAEMGGYPHYMMKEMHEQPRALRDTLLPLVKNGVPDFTDAGLNASALSGVSALHIVACGSAMHAGMLGKRLIETLSGVPVSVEIASEFRYTRQIFSPRALGIVISQSGETADTLAALRFCKRAGVPVAAIVNVPTSTIAREADIPLNTHAGPEIAVATTKGYCVQAGMLALLAIGLANARGKLSDKEARRLTVELTERLPAAIEEMLLMGERYRKAAAVLAEAHDVFYIGRAADYATSLECALKLKEISYIHCEAYAAGEMKHGTISLIATGTPVLALATSEKLFPKTAANIREVRSRGAYVFLLCPPDFENAADNADVLIPLPPCDAHFLSIASVVAGQMIAYETALLLGRDVDKPRNLAKSVTVE